MQNWGIFSNWLCWRYERKKKSVDRKGDNAILSLCSFLMTEDQRLKHSWAATFELCFAFGSLFFDCILCQKWSRHNFPYHFSAGQGFLSVSCCKCHRSRIPEKNLARLRYSNLSEGNQRMWLALVCTLLWTSLGHISIPKTCNRHCSRQFSFGTFSAI